MIRENVRLAQKFEAFVRSDNRWETENPAGLQDILAFNIKIYKLNILTLWPERNSGLRFPLPATWEWWSLGKYHVVIVIMTILIMVTMLMTITQDEKKIRWQWWWYWWQSRRMKGENLMTEKLLKKLNSRLENNFSFKNNGIINDNAESLVFSFNIF